MRKWRQAQLLWQRVGPVDVADDAVDGGSDVTAWRRRGGGYVGVQRRLSSHLADDVRQRFDVVLGQRQRFDLGQTLATLGQRRRGGRRRRGRRVGRGRGGVGGVLGPDVRDDVAQSVERVVERVHSLSLALVALHAPQAALAGALGGRRPRPSPTRRRRRSGRYRRRRRRARSPLTPRPQQLRRTTADRATSRIVDKRHGVVGSRRSAETVDERFHVIQRQSVCRRRWRWRWWWRRRRTAYITVIISVSICQPASISNGNGSRGIGKLTLQTHADVYDLPHRRSRRQLRDETSLRVLECKSPDETWLGYQLLHLIMLLILLLLLCACRNVVIIEPRWGPLVDHVITRWLSVNSSHLQCKLWRLCCRESWLASVHLSAQIKQLMTMNSSSSSSSSSFYPMNDDANPAQSAMTTTSKQWRENTLVKVFSFMQNTGFKSC